MLNQKKIKAALSHKENRPIRRHDGIDRYVEIYPAKRYCGLIKAINETVISSATVEGNLITIRYGATGKMVLYIAEYPQIVANEIIDIIYKWL